MNLCSLRVPVVLALVLPACMSGSNKGDMDDGGNGGFRPPDLVVQSITVGQGTRGVNGIEAVPIRIRVRNKRKGVDVPTMKPFHVSVVVRNPQLTPMPTPPMGAYADLAVPMSFGRIGFETLPLAGQTVPEKDLTVTIPLNPGESVLLQRTIYVSLPWDLPLRDPATNEIVPLQITATADWTNVIQEKNEGNNSKTVDFVSQ